ncbi:zinc-dependent metalloprotease [Flavobacterium sp. SM15]|uniref:zinc-dependent metalloprotease n=1 Tax=Flavobacterium sp. SM15 TaxID=2908005 RepID=UPI001EDC5C84|nr:zinc-dependent metalloprotease [Flavobacterium sp. SM15]MCG2612136.1 zinc-dependent metalloprotease [Flavobacterium sp. SM15]
MKKIILSALLFFGAVGYSQAPPCATDALLKKALKENPQAKEQLNWIDSQINSVKSYQGKDSTPPQASYTVPVVVYVVHDGTAATNISDTQVNSQLTALNQYFSNTGIKFCLATRAGSGTQVPMNSGGVQSTPGIIHIQNSTLTNHETATEQAQLMATAHSSITKEKFLRIWVVNTIDGGLPGVLGYAWFPGAQTHDGIVIRANVFGNGSANLLPSFDQGKTLVHEVGHYLGLYHTFEAGCSASTGDCSQDGDKVCDTPKASAPNYHCETGTNSCPEFPAVVDDISNYMDYGDNYCADHFSAGQIQRMQSLVSLYRSELVSYDNLIYAGTCDFQNAVSATIYPTTYTACANTMPITFYPLPAESYLWNFGDGTTSTLESPSHTYTSAVNSPYTVTLTVTGESGQAATSSIQVFVTDCSSFTPNSNSYWYLSSSLGLKFNGGIPVFDPTFPTNRQTQGSTVQNDSNGNMLFYSNGINVWNNQHTQINSNPLQNVMAYSASNVITLPKPGNNNQYWIFTNTYSNGQYNLGFRYHVVNTVNGIASMGSERQPVNFPQGLGFDAFTSDGALTGGTGLTAIEKCDGYWLLTVLKKGSVNYLVVYSFTSSGLSYVSQFQLSLGLHDYASIKAAPNGNKIFLHSLNTPSADGYYRNFIFDFNKAQGIISSPVEINHGMQSLIPNNSYGSFSPDSKLLYVTNNLDKKISQFNLNSVNINNSAFEFGDRPTSNNWGSIQQGPDNKLYISLVGSKNLAVIHSPNSIVNQSNINACLYTQNGPRNTSSLNVDMALPNLINAKTNTVFPSATEDLISMYTVGCNTYKFFPNVCGTSFNWEFKNNTTGVSFNTSVTNPVYVFAVNGAYTVYLKDNSNNVITSVNLTISGLATPEIYGSTEACNLLTGNSVTNNSTVLSAGQTAQWQIVGGTGTITGANNQSSVDVNWTDLPGTLLLTVTDAAGCSSQNYTEINSLCPCDCLNSLTLVSTQQTKGGWLHQVINTNTDFICQNLFLKYTWTTASGGFYVTYTNQLQGNFQGVTVRIDILNEFDGPLCSNTLSNIIEISELRLNNSSSKDTALKVTPNPSKGVFTVSLEDFKGDVNISVFDNNGRLVYTSDEKNFNIEKTINLSNLQSGMYILKVDSDNFNFVKKIIKE